MNDLHELRSQIERHLEGQLVWLERDHVHLHDGLSQAIRHSTSAERVVYAEALCQLLSSPDIRHRTGAIAVLTDVMPPLRSDRALACLGQIPAQPPAWNIGYPSLEQAAAIALAANATPDDAKTIEWLKSFGLQRSYADFLWVHLARLDPDWLMQQAHHIGHNVLGVIAALPESQRAAYIAAKAPWPPEVPTVLTRALWKKLPESEAQRLRSLMYPADQPLFVYQIGNEYAPDDPVGRETLSLTTEGRLTYERRHRSQVWRHQTNMESQAQATLKAVLADIGTASTLLQPCPPGASLVQIHYENQTAILDYYQGQKLPGYSQIIQIMDTYLQAFRQADK
ncbi:hypothetical protein [Vacuolonema iberomarrocanum]|uniref:hypothetical protein n=1 Tax=Vacuolonema iberomarrocanum TaxID=3454632 RepID=UPI001A0F8094|nr:hypothetical protein [filamentous cyanobacterium LEGE 07170]